jgi:hypothetical protein
MLPAYLGARQTGGSPPLGWQRYGELLRGAADSRKAFMAMPFGDAELNNVFRSCFIPAVDRAGFHLVRLHHNPPAGSIDDHLRVEIRTARFLVADLTTGNQGAYWEAGFAEGLGRPVIYTCKRSVWDQQRTHFDTNHLHTVVWDPTDLSDAGARLTASIRATFPADAKMTD